MDTRELEEIQRLRQSVEKIANSMAMSTAKILYDLGAGHFKNNNWLLCIATLKAASEVGDPYYSANALQLLGQVYHRLQDSIGEMEIYRRIADLPEEFAQFLDPMAIGFACSKVGKLEMAREYYRKAYQFAPWNLELEQNLAEVLILLGDLPEGLRHTEKSIARSEPRFFLVGRMLKGLGHYLSGQREQAEEEFRWVARFLMSHAAVPADFQWDFRDSQRLWDQVDSKIAQLVVQVLAKRITFDEFRRGYLQIEPARQ